MGYILAPVFAVMGLVFLGMAIRALLTQRKLGAEHCKMLVPAPTVRRPIEGTNLVAFVPPEPGEKVPWIPYSQVAKYIDERWKLYAALAITSFGAAALSLVVMHQLSFDNYLLVVMVGFILAVGLMMLWLWLVDGTPESDASVSAQRSRSFYLDIYPFILFGIIGLIGLSFHPAP